MAVNSIQDLYNQQYLATSGSSYAADYLSSSFNPYSSIFSGATFGGYTGYGYGFGYGDPSQYAQYNNQMANANLQMAHKNAATNSLYNAPEQAIERRMGVLQRQILKNNQDNIEKEYTKLYEEVRKMYTEAGYENVPDSQIRAYIENTYAQKTGSRLVDDIESRGHNPFVQGMIQGTGIGYLAGNKTTAEQNISMITGEEESTGSKAATWAGRAAGTAATVAVLPFVAKYGAKALKLLAKGYKALL